MQTKELTTDWNHAYKMRMSDGRWSPYLHFVKQDKAHFVFEPVEDNESTLDHHVLHIFIGAEGDVLKARHFVMNPKYAMWEPAPKA